MPDDTNDLVELLIQRHMVDQLRGYQGNLSALAHVAQNKWMPDENEPGVQQRLQTLQRYLAETGHPENDSFLLCFGLTVPGMQRGIVPPLMVLDDNRGGFSVRRQREAEGQIRRLRDALAIGRRFVPSLSRETKSAFAELAELISRRPRLGDTDWLLRFSKLSPDQAEQLAERALEYFGLEESVEEIGRNILTHSASFRHAPLSERTCGALIARGVLRPASLYRDSSDSIAERILSRINESAAPLALNHLLLALAWTRSVTAHRAFRQWTMQRPAWASKLHVPPEDYLVNAGWCLDGDGNRRDLISKQCFRLVPITESVPQSIRCRRRIDERCPSCESRMAWLLDFSHVSDDYFPGEFAEAPRKVPCCLLCAYYGPVFTAYHQDDTWEWLSGHEPRKSVVGADLKLCVRQIENVPCPPFVCAEPFTLNDASTLGGIPMWLQDAEFPRCIECGRVMVFLAQHDNGPLGEEGIYYAFFCPECHVAAVSYQQT